MSHKNLDQKAFPLHPAIRLLPVTQRNPAAGCRRQDIVTLEVTMKMRLVAALVGFTISFALPIFAQEKEEVKTLSLYSYPCWSPTSPTNRSDQSEV